MRNLDALLSNCNLCPRNCGVNRLEGQFGYCKTNANPLVASITLHKGEEPVLTGSSGICNVFFAHCNLACTYCQNHQISRNNELTSNWLSDYNIIVNQITEILDRGINTLGFVSPTHQVPQMVTIIKMLHQRGYNPTVVYNSNGYDNPSVLREIADLVDIYLPDIKYFSNDLGKRYSDVSNYFSSSMIALKEMVWQKGTSLLLDENGVAESGVIIRHLILPNHADDSKKILGYLATNISASLTIPLMSQYYPINSNFNKLSRTITEKEYNEVKNTMENLGFFRGWTQEFSSNNHYLPNFDLKKPFYSDN